MQLPTVFEAEDVKDKLRKSPGGAQMPLTVHLRQEIDRLNTVIVLTARVLKDLRLAIAGMRQYFCSDSVPSCCLPREIISMHHCSH